MLLVALFYAAIFYTANDLGWDARLAGQGRYENPIFFSALIATAILVILSASIPKTVTQWLLTGGLLAALLLFMILTQTRSTLVGLCACIVILAPLRGMKAAVLLLGLLGMTMFVGYLMWGQSIAELVARGDTHRFAIWREALDMVRMAPLLGHGLAFEPEFLGEVPGGPWKSTHNTVLGHLVHGGTVGLLLYIGLLGHCLYVAISAILVNRSGDNALKSAAVGNFAALGLIYVAVMSQFDFAQFLVGVNMQWLLFWVPVSVCLYLEGVGAHRAHRSLATGPAS